MYYQEYFETLAQDNQLTSYHGKAHRFTKEELGEILSAKEMRQGLFFIVGGAQTLLKVEKTLITLGISKNRIHDERLTM